MSRKRKTGDELGEVMAAISSTNNLARARAELREARLKAEARDLGEEMGHKIPLCDCVAQVTELSHQMGTLNMVHANALEVIEERGTEIDFLRSQVRVLREALRDAQALVDTVNQGVRTVALTGSGWRIPWTDQAAATFANIAKALAATDPERGG